MCSASSTEQVPTVQASNGASEEVSSASLGSSPTEETAVEDGWIIQWLNGSSASACDAVPGGCFQTFSHALSGAALRLSRSNLSSFLEAHSSALSAVYADGELHSTGMQVQSVGGTAAELEVQATTRAGRWGLDRIDQASLPLDGLYHYTETGAGVTVYVIDSGIRATHEEFWTSDSDHASRAFEDFTSLSSGTPNEDCQGHGTHVAGVVGGRTFGVAKDATLRALRVLDCDGTGLVSGAIAALDWVVSNGQKPAVVTMSMAGDTSSALDAAVTAAVQAGFTVVVAAGNGDTDACGVSPARTALALTIGASDGDDRRLFYQEGSASNYGACVDLFAPGTNIQSAGSDSDTDSAYRTGTSQAVPFVAGVVALRLQASPGLSPSNVASEVVAGAVRDKLSSPEGSDWTFASSTTQNLFLQSLDDSVAAPPPATSYAAAPQGAPAAQPSPGNDLSYASLPPPTRRNLSVTAPTPTLTAGAAPELVDGLGGGSDPIEANMTSPSPSLSPPPGTTVVMIEGSEYGWVVFPWGTCEASSCYQERVVSCEYFDGQPADVGTCQAFAVIAGTPQPVTYQQCCSGPSPSDDGSGGLATGAIVAIAVGAAFGIALVILIIFLLVRRRRKKDKATAFVKSSQQSKPSDPSDPELALPPPPPPILTPHSVYVARPVEDASLRSQYQATGPEFNSRPAS